MEDAADQARDMLAAFASVGAQRFDLTLTDAAGGKVEFRPDCPIDRLRPALATILRDAATRQHNVIVRPRTEDTALVQLDDLDAAAAQRLRPVSFLVLRTSPGSYQAWVAVAGPADADFARRLRKGAGADPAASGATRVSGSLNFKEKYAPAFPRVETVHARPGLIVTRAELEALGVVAPPEKTEPAGHARVSHRRPGPRGWPSYRRCVENAPPARDGGRPDISRADFTFCLIAIDWGWGVEETAARLLQESGKARENGEPYALRTARNAAAAVERRRRAAAVSPSCASRHIPACQAGPFALRFAPANLLTAGQRCARPCLTILTRLPPESRRLGPGVPGRQQRQPGGRDEQDAARHAARPEGSPAQGAGHR